MGCIYDPLINYRKYCLAQNKLQDKNAFISHITTIIKEVCEAEDIDTISENARGFLKEGFIYTCPISKQRINNAVKAQQEPGSNPFRRDVYYEQSTIQAYLENPTGQLPPNWPKGVAFCQDNLVEMEEERLFLEQLASVKKNQAEWLESLSS